jgi:hypothetical protein
VPALPSVFMSYSSKDLEIVEGIENYFYKMDFMMSGVTKEKFKMIGLER